MVSSQLLCIMAASLALLTGCGGNDENASEMSSRKEGAPATTQAMAAVGEGAATVLDAPPGSGAPAPAAFQLCLTCHTVERGKNGVGPSLVGVVGRKAGSLPGYNYSPALRNGGFTWDAQKIDRWLTGPGKMVPGVRMAITVPDPAERQEIVRYLETLK